MLTLEIDSSNASTTHAFDDEPIRANHDRLSSLGHSAECLVDEATHRGNTLLGEFLAEQLAQFSEAEAAAHPESRLAFALDVGLLHVVLVVNLSVDLFEHVLHRD